MKSSADRRRSTTTGSRMGTTGTTGSHMGTTGMAEGDGL
jgi:hypothetical protein